jgi:uncharacterized GH25 family protein
LLVAVFGIEGAYAHEFWIEPTAHQVETGDQVLVDLRVGQMLDGRSYPYLSHKFSSYTVSDQTGSRDLLGNEGDIPSISYEAAAPGLHIISYHAVAERITFDEFQLFAEYVEEEGHGTAIRRHRERGLPETGFVEGYTRNAKALIQVGPADPTDKDRATGMPFELIALENPYAAKGKNLRVALRWNGEPAAGFQVAVFRKTGPGNVERVPVRTDADGVATIPLAGGGRFLLSAIYLEESPPAAGETWTSTWASLTFELPMAAAANEAAQ